MRGISFKVIYQGSQELLTDRVLRMWQIQNIDNVVHWRVTFTLSFGLLSSSNSHAFTRGKQLVCILIMLPLGITTHVSNLVIEVYCRE